ncbi:MAG TPA: CoA pyrophosphatase [Candidatus Dormibacteraeota bacterium]|nr:CoA pyrophosphatase [Candidatus Dormibacteraeota bacterium]
MPPGWADGAPAGGASGRLDRLLRSLDPIEEASDPGEDGSLRSAAVLALIDPDRADLPLLLLRRSWTLRTHPGQVGLPGGTPAAEDAGLWQTALREAEEELAVPTDAVELQGRASVVPTWNSGYAITPFVAFLRRQFVPQPAGAEVDSYFWFPLQPAGGRPERVSRAVTVAQGTLEMPGYLHGEHFVWGATGAIVDDLLARMGGPG